MRRRAELGAMVLAGCAGASLWISLGTLAIADDRVGRTGALPPLWVLPALAVATAAIAWAVRLRLEPAWPLSLAAVLWLPWLPMPIPAAVLAWEGPLEAVVWLTIAAGLVATSVARMPVRLAAVLGDPRRAPWIGAAVFLGCSLTAAAALQSRLPGGDEPHYLVITQSLLYDGDLAIQNNHERGDFLDYIVQDIRPHYLQRGANGEIYSIHAPGLPALLLPVFAVAGYAGALVLVAIISALAVALSWRAALTLTRSAPAAWAAAIGVGLSATFFLHSFTIFPDPVGAAVVALAAGVLVTLDAAPAAVGRAQLALAGGALALLPWLHTRFALIAGGFGAIYVLRLITRSDRWRAVATFVSVPVLAGAGWFLSFLLIYGTVNPMAPYGEGRQTAVEWLPAGLAGLVFDQQFGLGANAPVFALVPFGWWVLWRTRRRLAIEIAVVALPYTAAVASFGMWWGGWSAPGRFLVALLPLAMIALAAAWTHASVAGRAVLVALTAIGGLNTVVRVWLEDGALLYNVRDGYDLLLDWLSGTVNLPLALPSVHRLGAEPTALLGAVWILAGAVGWLALRFAFGTGSSLAWRWTATSWVAALMATAALGVSWTVARTRPATPESSQIAFVQRWRPEARPLVVALPRLRRVDPDSALRALSLRTSIRARDLGATRPLVSLRHLPAGEYRLVVEEGDTRLAGTVTVTLGGTSQTIEQWSLDGLRAGLLPFVLRLPTRAASVTMHGDEAARARINVLALHPERVGTAESHSRRRSLRAARYGAVQAFFLDESSYMEPGGIWTRGDGVTELIVGLDGDGPVALDLTAGPVPATVSLLVADERRTFTLEADERRRVELSTGLWRLETIGRFRPKDFDETSHDARPLGVRLEFVQADAASVSGG